MRSAVFKRLFAQSGDAHHEELVEVRAENRQELHALQQRHFRRLGFFQHPPVELQPAQLAVDEMLGKKLLLAHGSGSKVLHVVGCGAAASPVAGGLPPSPIY
ncbi:MAG: hypothetical protein QM775_06545 [Pirellulales bacterium]